MFPTTVYIPSNILLFHVSCDVRIRAEADDPLVVDVLCACCCQAMTTQVSEACLKMRAIAACESCRDAVFGLRFVLYREDVQVMKKHLNTTAS